MRYPTPWLAAALGFFAQPLGMLYVARPAWAVLYFLGPLLIGIAMFLSGLSQLTGILSLAVSIVVTIHAYRLAKRTPEGGQRPAYSRWYGMLGITMAAVIAIFLFRAFLFEPFHIPAGSMMPNFRVGQHVVVSKWGYGHYGSFGITPFRTGMSEPLGRGDVVVFDYPIDPSLQYIKRIVGLPGDVVVIRGNELAINEKPVEREYLPGAILGMEQYLESMDGNRYVVLLGPKSPLTARPITSFPSIDRCQYSGEELRCSVPAGHYYMLGDNRDNSMDSRYWGFVPQENIVGKIAYTTP